MKRRTMLSMLPAAGMFAPAAKPPQPQNDFKGVVNAGDYPTLQAAADAAFGTLASPHGTANVTQNKKLYIPNGIWTPPFSGAPVLDLRYLHGGVIEGAGQFATKLRQNVAGVPVIRTNGCGYSEFSDFLLDGSPESTLLDLSWDGTAGGAALQSNKFRNLLFLNGNIGVDIGRGGFMGSENSFLDCYWQSQAVAGMVTSNFNALQQSIWGGNFQNCRVAIWVGVGSINIVHGVGFQVSGDCDILTSGSANNSMSVVGCRTESVNFIHNDASHAMHVSCCQQWGGTPGRFIRSIGGIVVLTSPFSQKGKVEPRGWCQMTVENGNFNNEFMDASGLGSYATYRGALDIRNTFYVDSMGIDRLIRSQHWTSPNNGTTIEKMEAVYQTI